MRRVYALAAALVLVALCCGCGRSSGPQVQVEIFLVRAQVQEIELVAVHRLVSSGVPRARAVLDELLQGPTADERRQGLSTLINDGVIVRSVSTDLNGVVHADFSERLQEKTGGSMRVLGIRRQIEATLLKIPGVTSVILSIEGQSEGILQP